MSEETCKKAFQRNNIRTREQLFNYIKTLKHNDRVNNTDSEEKIVAMAVCGQYYLKNSTTQRQNRSASPSPKRQSRRSSPSKPFPKDQEGGEGIKTVFSFLSFWDKTTKNVKLPSSLSKKTDIDNSLISSALSMMMDYFQHIEDEEGSSMMSKFINASLNTIKKLIRIPIQFSQYVLKNKTLFSILFMLIKILKIVFCIWTGGLVNKKIIRKTIESVTKYFANDSPMVLAFTDLVTEITSCFATNGLNLVLVGVCISKFAVNKLAGYDLSKYSTWTWKTLLSILSRATSMFSGDFSKIFSFQELIRNPSVIVAKMIFGEQFRTGDDVKFFDSSFRTKKNNTLSEKLVHYMTAESDIFILCVVLNFIPAKFLKWFINHLSDFMIDNVQIEALKVLITTFKQTTGSCLDLLSWIMTTSVDYEIMKYVIFQMKDLFMDVIPCLFAKIKGYIIRLYNKDYDEDELVNCCGSSIQSAIELAMRKDYYTWSNPVEWVSDSVQGFFYSSGSLFKSLRKQTLGWDGKSLSKGRRKFSGFKTKRGKNIYKDGAVGEGAGIVDMVIYNKFETLFRLGNPNFLNRLTLRKMKPDNTILHHDLYNILILEYTDPLGAGAKKYKKADNSEIYPNVYYFTLPDVVSYQSIIEQSLVPNNTDGARKKFHYKKSQPKKKIYLKRRVTSKKQQQK